MVTVLLIGIIVFTIEIIMGFVIAFLYQITKSDIMFYCGWTTNYIIMGLAIFNIILLILCLLFGK